MGRRWELLAASWCRLELSCSRLELWQGRKREGVHLLGEGGSLGPGHRHLFYSETSPHCWHESPLEAGENLIGEALGKPTLSLEPPQLYKWKVEKKEEEEKKKRTCRGFVKMEGIVAEKIRG